jgi:hypothetical protein
MYAGTGISTDSARRKKAKKWARWTARQCKKLFQAKPMPELQGPNWQAASASGGAGMGFARSSAAFTILNEEK